MATPVPSEFRAKCVRAGTNNNVVYLDGAPILYFPVFAQGKRFATKLNAAFAYAVKTASFSDSGAGNQLGDFFTQAANPANGFNPTLPVGS